MDEYRPGWTTGQKIACLALFAVAMLALRFVLHAVVPPMHDAATAEIGAGPVAAIIALVFLACAFFGYRPLVAGWLAKRRLDAGK